MRKKNAYFTVEAALVLPLVIGALLLTIFLFVFQYDRCLLEQDMGLLMLYAVTLEENEEEEARRFSERASELSLDKYVAWEMEELRIIREKNEVRAEGEGSLSFPLPEWNLFNRENVWRSRAVRRAVRISPADAVRAYRKLQGGE